VEAVGVALFGAKSTRVVFGRRPEVDSPPLTSSPVNFEGVLGAIVTHNGTRLSAAIKALGWVTPASYSRDHKALSRL